MLPELILSDRDEQAAETVIGDGLDGFNAETVGYADGRPLNVLVRDPATGETVGGIIGRSSLGLWFVSLVFLPKSLRGGGTGTRMLALAEAEARRRGCRAGMLYTISFQAPEFYERQGWRRFGEIPCDPPGNARVFMTKPL